MPNSLYLIAWILVGIFAIGVILSAVSTFLASPIVKWVLVIAFVCWIFNHK